MAVSIEQVKVYTKGIATLLGVAATEAVTLGLDRRYWWVGVVVGVLAVLGVVASPKNKDPRTEQVVADLMREVVHWQNRTRPGAPVGDAERTDTGPANHTGPPPDAPQAV